ncbi:hypothetical protein GDO78_020044 [Eleutherodactylus coqui]|uniref:Uncharacterized protein n=1 Tax=Eleutherodactylus coqui TaxID=57060 RepID=A0A8J6C654_ELECQ|nr:hypothetical protein GDO78_020044 [Eleutherodactylus coqui]
MQILSYCRSGLNCNKEGKCSESLGGATSCSGKSQTSSYPFYLLGTYSKKEVSKFKFIPILILLFIDLLYLGKTREGFGKKKRWKFSVQELCNL